MTASRKIHFKWNCLPFVLAHIACIGAFWLPFSWSLVALCLFLAFVRMFGVTAGYHRYFAHRSYKTGRPFQFVLAILGLLALQKGPLWWAAHHRDHHRFSDKPGDPHSPRLDGFFWAHIGWILTTDHDATKWHRVADLARYPELRWLNKHFLVPGLTLAAGLFLVGGAPALVWGFFISTVLTWHATFAINSLTHLFGRRRYQTEDDSRNSLLLAILTLGEGWHNNHHYYMGSTRQGFFWWEIDISYYVIRLLAALGLVWDVREPPATLYTQQRHRWTASPHLQKGLRESARPAEPLHTDPAA